MGRQVRVLQATAGATTVRSSGGDHSTTAQSVAAPPPEAVTLESDFVVILAALLCALIGVVGLIAVARCSCLRRRHGGGVAQPRTPANKGLKKKVLQSLPKFTYISSSSSNDNSSSSDKNCIKKWMVTSDCAICLAEFQEGDEIRVLPQCGHGFHLGCIDTWLVSHSSCPSCRQILDVPRCQKCGLYPALPNNGPGSGSSGGGVVVITVDESETKVGEAGNGSTEVSTANGEGRQHEGDNDNGDMNTNSIANDNENGNSTNFLP